MKKGFFIVTICVVIVLLSACGKNLIQDGDGTEIEIVLTDQGSETYSSAIAEEKEFYEMILNNPIDKTFVWDGDERSIARIEKAAQYRDLWKAEIEHSLAVLKEKLSEEDYALLESSYVNWREYMDATMSVEQEIFYVDSSYGTGNNLTYPLVMEAYAKRTKEYAIELKALEYAFTGMVEFNSVVLKSIMQEEEKIWSEQEIANMFYSMVNGENGIEYIDSTLMPDHTSDCIGAVLFKNTEDGTTMVAFFDEEGFAHTCGTYAKVAEEADFAYLGDGTVTFKVEMEKDIFCNYNVTISVEEDNVAFVITEDWQ